LIILANPFDQLDPRSIKSLSIGQKLNFLGIKKNYLFEGWLFFTIVDQRQRLYWERLGEFVSRGAYILGSIKLFWAARNGL